MLSITFLLFFLLCSCGVKKGPIAPPGHNLPSVIESYKIKIHDKKLLQSPNQSEEVKKEKEK